MQSLPIKILSIATILGLIIFLLWQSNIFKKLPLAQNNPEVNQNIGSTAENGAESFIENLRKREFKGGEIKIEETISSNNLYTSYLFSYPSDDLTIYGKMNIPAGVGPFSVILLNHGYFNQSTYISGNGTDGIANILAANGYLTLASDYRGFGKSENDGLGSRGHNPNYAIDILNLIASLKSLPKADQNKIGMWGHSMGGEVSLRTIEVTSRVKALVLWAPTSGRSSDNAAFYGGRRGTPGPSSPNLEDVSPINYLKYITTPISLHQGLADTEVRPEWSKELNEALKREGKSVEYFEYEDQDHNFRNLGWDVISPRTIDFFDKYLR
ncbi:hypothetical protein A2778_05475 [Candidatus Daviesbacteria bacterium RIFCSPHIGHO2_01_FULL_40_24]|uniref:Putative peptidase n=1 Tax=Candidatus Daviesbacteria bacterium GW2011_GWC2_40_12 TaxID=1618431 RepID=A0A0G0QQV1_9BACT|nr:MAG: putative peptidase [Candidatus Daviesbacteria bacterium GW2011_GWA2_39_33]KKR42814.1 MAG: putative peptidase [Candidatus Daviesbacteria bacterium GW2011_GWC2_40_12]OGE21607.1 MAG: hypothetical protein A2778_05475 [Candidatus Daviesbacteria bacterium RIFCSPHIGHO2_01_FULL_40_24]OGE30004.1 MAG: hypothetical protein A3C29_01180 [Candidatus Daviesbacteria bacterium RIFCSPHIGHO2_02_FULL_40_16]OGE43561.1 MAG: hypothetical protein A3A53_02935 [Candidatus Daviesbacteria bacterium RIFCSPLOWO2_01_